MLDIEIDGKKVSVPEGVMVIQAAEAAGTYIPHFCYHKKLSIAANCRMCLVDVEKAPKPMPACATPVTQGMVVRTKSERAIKAQQSVMEFLLINHPLDCPICDQGGECQLQDLAVGYGKSASRYHEEKRVVLHKQAGPLVAMEEMSRCIQCTRCVRFGQEVAGDMELGMRHRGEHSEIATFEGRTIDSELSGNMIDICPVGALTSKPFRYAARTWELARRRTVSPHDSTGANLVAQIKNHRVLRVVPLENEAVNECWIADRDRYSYEALSSEQRLLSPMIKQGGQWQAVDWNTALGYVADGLKRVKVEFGTEGIGALASPHATLEELHLLGALVRGLGSQSIDHRLRHTDFSVAPTVRWLGRPIASLSTLNAALVIGSNLRKDHPLFAQRLRQATRRGGQVLALDAGAPDWAMPVTRITAAPSQWLAELAQIAAAVAAARNAQVENGAQTGRVTAPLDVQPSASAQAMAQALLSGEHTAVLLGNQALAHPQATQIWALAEWIAAHTGATVGCLGEAANSVGAQCVGALPGAGGLHAGQMLSQPMKALLLWNVEPVLDAANGAAAAQALAGSGLVVAFTAFKDARVDNADVLLPIAPFTETAGTFVNAEGRSQPFHGVVRPLGETRPGWKVLRVLGTLLGLPGFDFDSIDDVRSAIGEVSVAALPASDTPQALPLTPAAPRSADAGFERLADVPLYAIDPLVRRADALQRTADARTPPVGLPSALWAALGLPPANGRAAPRAAVRVRVDDGEAITTEAREEPWLAPDVVRVAMGHAGTALAGSATGRVQVQACDKGAQ